MTLHRPALVDGPLLIRGRCSALGDIGGELPVLFPVHPRTRRRLEAARRRPPASRFVDPLGYLDFLVAAGRRRARADRLGRSAGGEHRASASRASRCATNTERPVTVRAGTNTLLGLEPERIADILPALSEPLRTDATIPPLWDGRAAERVGEVLERALLPGRAALA